MDIKIVGKKKRKRSANVTSAFNGTNNNNSNDNNNNKNSDTKTIDKPKIIPIAKKIMKDNTSNTTKDSSDGSKKTKQVSQVLQTLLANKDHEKTYKNEKERLQAQLSNCPDDVDTEDKEIFEEMPVEDFGMAMLRGMGWNPKKKVNTSNGKNGKKNTNNDYEDDDGPDPFIPKARAGRLGLGAISFEDLKKKQIDEPKRKKMKKMQELAKSNYNVGDIIECKNYVTKIIEYGRVINVNIETIKAVVGRSKKVMDLSLLDTNIDIKVINENILPKDHYIHIDNNRSMSSNSSSKGSSMTSNTNANNDDNNNNNNMNNVDMQSNWLIPNIRVRINYENIGGNGNKYYAMKGVIRDVVQPKVCTLVMDTDGVILNNIKQEWLNSALPKKSGRVMILSGKRKFKSGQMLLRDKKTKRVHVKLDSKDKVKQFSYDEVAEYLG